MLKSHWQTLRCKHINIFFRFVIIFISNWQSKQTSDVLNMPLLSINTRCRDVTNGTFSTTWCNYRRSSLAIGGKWECIHEVSRAQMTWFDCKSYLTLLLLTLPIIVNHIFICEHFIFAIFMRMIVLQIWNAAKCLLHAIYTFTCIETISCEYTVKRCKSVPVYSNLYRHYCYKNISSLKITRLIIKTTHFNNS